jgi:hypothetical protein
VPPENGQRAAAESGTMIALLRRHPDPLVCPFSSRRLRRFLRLARIAPLDGGAEGLSVLTVSVGAGRARSLSRRLIQTQYRTHVCDVNTMRREGVTRPSRSPCLTELGLRRTRGRPLVTGHDLREVDLPRFRGHLGYGALYWGSEGMSAATSMIPASLVMGAPNVFWGGYRDSTPLVRVAPRGSTELAW